MVVEVANPRNQHIHNGDKPVVGVIAAAEELPNRVLYTNTNANRIYNDMQHDIYQSSKKASPPSKFPAIIPIVIGIISVSTALIFRKKLVSLCNNIWKSCKNIFSKVKNIFKKTPMSPPTTTTP